MVALYLLVTVHPFSSAFFAALQKFVRTVGRQHYIRVAGGLRINLLSSSLLRKADL